MKRKTILVCALLSMLIATITGTGFASSVKANPVGIWQFRMEPLTDTPIVSVLSPMNGTTQQNKTSIVVNVLAPDSWTLNASPPYKIYYGKITSVSFFLDDSRIMYNDTLYGLQSLFYPGDTYGIRNINYTQEVGQLSLGFHNLTVCVEASTCYTAIDWFNMSTSETYPFLVCAPPSITSLSVQNTTYDRPFLPLILNVNETPTGLGYNWLGFSLDNRANVTIGGNVTLTGLTEGNHSLVVYANDTFGNMGKSDTTFFSIILPTPTTTPTPLPTVQPTVEPSPTPTANLYSNGILYAAVAAIVLVGIGATAVLFWKRKRLT